MAAGPLYVLVGLAQALTREGFDMRRHALSLLSNGRLGWIQISNFLLSGLLVIAGAVGLRKQFRLSTIGTWGSLLLGVYGLGLIGAGIFVADPGGGFPPEAIAPAQMSRSGLLHFACGGLGFYALIAAALVFARLFWKLRERAWSIYSIITAVGFLISFALIASGSKSSAVILGFYFAVLWIWVWHTLLYVKISRGA